MFGTCYRLFIWRLYPVVSYMSVSYVGTALYSDTQTSSLCSKYCEGAKEKKQQYFMMSSGVLEQLSVEYELQFCSIRPCAAVLLLTRERHKNARYDADFISFVNLVCDMASQIELKSLYVKNRLILGRMLQ